MSEDDAPLAPANPDWSGLLDAIDRRAARREESRPLSTVETAAVGFGRWKTIISAVVFFVVLVSGGALTFSEIQAKPTVKQVDAIVETAVEPVRAKAKLALDEVEGVGDDVGEIKEDVQRQGEVQSYMLEQMAWQGDVIQHIAQKKRPASMPKKPESLKRKERELLGQ